MGKELSQFCAPILIIYYDYYYYFELALLGHYGKEIGSNQSVTLVYLLFTCS